MIQSIATSHKTVMITGHFDPFTYAHLAYFKEAIKLGDFIYCIVSSDEQARLKKGKANQPASQRAEIVDLILTALGVPHQVYVNTLERDTGLVAKAIEFLHPDIFCRGSDKAIDDMPVGERIICDRMAIPIIHTKGAIAHGSEFV